MTQKRSLPLADVATRRPTVDAIRRRLGGRAQSEPGAGALVRIEERGGARAAPGSGVGMGVVLFARGDELDVWVEHGVVRRLLRWETSPAAGTLSAALESVASDARAFAALVEGERVRYDAGDGQLAEGALVEKCRFGALVLRDDGVVMGVGFRRIWRAGAAAGSGEEN